MLAELDVVVFLKSHDDLNRMADRVFSVLHSSYNPIQTSDDTQADDASSSQIEVNGYEALGLGFRAFLFANEGEQNDPEFGDYQFGLEITSDYWCVDLDTLDLEGPLSELYSRQLAFELDIETATEILLETTEEAEIFEIRSYRRNPQFRLDQAPTTPRVFMISARQVELPFADEENWRDGEDADTETSGSDINNEEGTGEPL